jgi:hypothetical protein
MHKKKKGAMELSINTIIIIVIGITLLTLGLVFVKGVFEKITEISDDTFGTAKTEISKMHGESRFTVPPVIKVKQGGITTEKIYVGNDGVSCPPNQNNFKLILTPSNVETSKLRAQVISQEEVRIREGYEAEFVIQVAATSDAPLTKGSINPPSYKADVTCGDVIYANSAFTIEVEKGSGLFG